LRTATIRAGSIGAALKGGLNLFGVLARSRRRPRRKGTLRVAAVDAVRDTAAFAAFLAAFAGVYVAVDEGIAFRVGRQRSKEWRAAVAGALAAPALLLADPRPVRMTDKTKNVSSKSAEVSTGRTGARHDALATYVALRACVLLVRSLLKRREKGELSRPASIALTPFASDRADVGLMCASSTVILSCFILRRDAVLGSYAKFLDRHGGKSVDQYLAAGALARARDAEEIRDVLRAYAATLRDGSSLSRSAELAEWNEMTDAALTRKTPAVWRWLIHPEHSSSFRHFLEFFFRSFPRSFTVNAPLYLVSALLVHREKLFSNPGAARRSLLGAARSGAFLSAYCALAWLGPDLAQTVFGTVRWWTISLGVSAAGLATFLEKPSRRQELGIYCASRAVEATGVVLAGAEGGLPGEPRWRGIRFDVMTFALAAAAVMRCYANERDVFRSKYLNVLDYVFGNQGHAGQRVRHVGSAYRLMTEPPAEASPATSPKKRR
jgi:hypothetical protein